jgi:hypothetical protein
MKLDCGDHLWEASNYLGESAIDCVKALPWCSSEEAQGDHKTLLVRIASK